MGVIHIIPIEIVGIRDNKKGQVELTTCPQSISIKRTLKTPGVPQREEWYVEIEFNS